MTEQYTQKQANDDNHMFSLHSPFTQCLCHEVNFLKNSDMSLLIDPLELYNMGDDGSSWNDAMAFLKQEDTIQSSKKNYQRFQKQVSRC